MTISIPRLDLMIAYSCNLSCRGCISISDRQRDGVEPYQKLQQSIVHWSKLISPDVVSLFGGEPLLHPRLFDVIRLVREHWNHATIRLITNGYLLTRFDPKSWFEFNNFEMQVSLHRLDHRKLLQDEVAKIIRCRHPWTVRSFDEADHKQLSWQYDSIKIYFSIFKDFVVPYQAQGQKILPWRSDPADAHKICGAPNTPVLHRGKLYKCPAVANAIELAKENWFNYHPVEDLTGLQDFVDRIGKPETVCGQCPNQAQAVIIDHFDSRNVDVR